MKQKKACGILAGISSLLFTGCSSQKTYDFVSAQTNSTVYSQMIDKINPIQYLALGFYLYMTKYAVIIIVLSIVMGIVVMMAGKKSSSIKKIALKGLILGVPLIMLGLIFVANLIVATI